jgi:hypothetical protein
MFALCWYPMRLLRHIVLVFIDVCAVTVSATFWKRRRGARRARPPEGHSDRRGRGVRDGGAGGEQLDTSPQPTTGPPCGGM